jgi:TRAP transporter TAXI family solute receptor
MPRIIRQTLLSVRDLLAAGGPFIVLALALLMGAYFVLDPTPPKRVVLATGPEHSDYAEFGKRYQAELKKYGIQVELRTSGGSSANRRLLRDPKEHVDFAFVVGGSSEALRNVDEDDDQVKLETLGSLFYEPIWIFYRQAAVPGGKLTRLSQLEGKRVNYGGRGSGTANVSNKILNAAGVQRDEVKVERLDQTPAVTAFLDGKLDALVFVSAPESSMVQMLLRTPKVGLYEFPQAEAYARRFPFLSPVVMPRGVIDLARDMPPHDVTLIAPTTMLVTREGTHPALIQLFVQAAQRIHGGAGWFAKAGQFPSPSNSELPIADEAERFYKSGPPLLERYLPFWLANLIDRMWVALFSIVAVLIPLSRVVPPLYALRVRSRIFRWYRDLRGIEDDLSHREAGAEALLERLNRLDHKAERINVPLAYTDELYRLRSHIQLVRERLRASA